MIIYHFMVICVYDKKAAGMLVYISSLYFM